MQSSNGHAHSSNGHAREHVLQDVRAEAYDLARKGFSVTEIVRNVNGHKKLTEAEESLIEVLALHAVAEVTGRY
jgi:phosphoserine aminotransferase